MRTAALVVLAASLAACGKPPEPPAAPSPEAIGSELASFRQLLVPISTSTWAGMQAAISHNDPSRAAAYQYPRPYAHQPVLVAGKEVSALIAYTSVWLVPAPVPLQPMSAHQFLRAFGADEGADLAGVVSPKGSFFFTREQVPDIASSARAAGASPEDLPYGVVHGVGRKPER